MFTGAVAASYYGTPRTTMDVDVVVNISPEDSQSLLLKPLEAAEIRVDENKMLAALRAGYRVVTLRDEKTAYTLDLILSDKKLEKKSGKIVGLPSFIQTPEELILSKLRMIKSTISKEKSQKDRDDVKAILSHTRVEGELLRRRARKENTLAMLDELMGKEL
jgi:hypothetical protein